MKSDIVEPRKDLSMNKHRSLFLLTTLLFILFIFSSCKKNYDFTRPPVSADPSMPTTMRIIHPDSEVRGVWIASVFNLDFPTKPDLSAEELKAEIDAILDTCEKNNLNTIFFQVRPSCDALYHSEIFPVAGVISTNGVLEFDPLDYIVREGHKRNIFVHAWVNPLRVTVLPTNIEDLPDNHPVKKDPSLAVKYSDGKLYLNAALPAVHDLVADGVREIVKKYDVDGIVFDDYFYPYPAYDNSGKAIDFDDAKEYELYGKNFDNVADWRRDNINRLIEKIYHTVHDTDPDCVFGVSPFAVWQNDNGQNGGSATANFEAYHSLYCDALAWIDGGYIDYISPQIYWDFDTKSSPFDVVTRWWNAKLNGTNIKLYVSHAAYRYEEGEWADPIGELSEQIQFARSEESYRGSIFYGYEEINKNTRGASDDLMFSYKDEIIYTDIQSNGHGVTFTSPQNGTVTYEKNTFLIGMADPYYSLTMNGQKIGTTKSGFFSVYVELKKGENTFTFTQNGVDYDFTITYATSQITNSTEPKDPVLSSLSPTSIYPTKSIATSADSLWVSCIAPYNSNVSATVGGVTTPLILLGNPKTTYAAGGYVGVTYGASIKLPSASEGEILEAGNITFSVSHRDGTVTAKGANVRVLGKDAFLCVRAKDDYTLLKISETSSYYNDYTVQSKGMTDFAVNQKNGFYELRMGGYVSEDLVEEIPVSHTPSAAEISRITVSNEGKYTTIRCATSDKLVYHGEVVDGHFAVTLFNVNSATSPVPEIAENPLFVGCKITRNPTSVTYAFPLRDTRNFYGFDLHYEDDAVVVSARNPIPVDFSSDAPLAGITIVLDAGHGGYDIGAPGVFTSPSTSIHEKDINLRIATAVSKKLSALGANVLMTRVSDSNLSLDARVKILEGLEPDLCLSIHQNSMGYTSDITRIRGALALWCMDGGRLLADEVGEHTASSLGRHYQGSRYQMLAMCKNPKFPAALIEVGFMTSMEEYELMVSEVGIQKAASGITDGILSYFQKQTEFSQK